MDGDLLLVGDFVPEDWTILREPEFALQLSNLEGPVLREHELKTKAPKAGPHLFTAGSIDSPERRIFSTANNHFMDFGVDGASETIAHLKPKGARFVGFGSCAKEARVPLRFNVANVRVSVIAATEAQFGVAGDSWAGVAEEGTWIHRAIVRERSECDFVIVSLHGGLELSPWPSPSRVERYRALVDTGADIVYGHHAHVPQGIEAYGGGHIFYGLGNYAVNPTKWESVPNALWSNTVALTLRDNAVCVEIHPVEIQSKHQSKTFEVVPIQRDIYAKYMELAALPLQDADLLQEVWQEVALRHFVHYAADMSGNAHFIRGRSGPSKLLRQWRSVFRIGEMQSAQAAAIRYHLFSCESHREVIRTALGVLAGEVPVRKSEQATRLVDDMLPWSQGLGNRMRQISWNL